MEFFSLVFLMDSVNYYSFGGLLDVSGSYSLIMNGYQNGFDLLFFYFFVFILGGSGFVRKLYDDCFSIIVEDFQIKCEYMFNLMFKRLCLVCGDIVFGYYYGVVLCEVCKVFFKRII